MYLVGKTLPRSVFARFPRRRRGMCDISTIIQDSSQLIQLDKKRKAPQFWADRENQRRFLDGAGRRLGVKSLEDWYQIPGSKLKKLGGARLLKKNGNSIAKLILSVYSDHQWHPWRFIRAPRGFWEDPHNRKQYFNWLGLQLGVPVSESGERDLSKWYTVRLRDARMLGATRPLARFYQFSLIKALKALYPEHEWLEWRFHQTSRSYFAERENRISFFTWAMKQLQLRHLSEWYGVSNSQVAELGGEALLVTYSSNSLAKALMDCFPDHEWQPSMWAQRPSATPR